VGRFISLLYHDVHPGATFDYGRMHPAALMYHVSEIAFRRHLQLIKESGHDVMFCFDDGWAGAVSIAPALLRDAGLRGFFFITTGFLGRTYFTTAEGIRRVADEGFTVGSHGVTHRMLSSLPVTEIRAELVDSKAQLEDIIGKRVTTFSIPGGARDRRVVETALDVGYTDIFTSTIAVNPTRSGRHDIARIGVTRSTSDATLRRWLAFQLGRERWRKKMLSVPKALLGMRAYTRLRRTLLGSSGHEHYFDP
jgi:peptidoglycan/xylan/chitin deacetylase (PgdA/CDA1 family)